MAVAESCSSEESSDRSRKGVSQSEQEQAVDVMRRFLRVTTTLVRCFPTGAFEHRAGQRSSGNPEHSGEPLGMGCEQQAQRPGKGHDPLSHGHPGEHVVDQVLVATARALGTNETPVQPASIAESWRGGRLSHTKYHLSDLRNCSLMSRFSATSPRTPPGPASRASTAKR
jgi:hypothetical protein